VVVGQTSIAQVATGLAAAINADGTSGALVAATSTAAGVVNIAGKDALFALNATTSNSATQTSASGTAIVIGGLILVELTGYTQTSPSSNQFRMTANVSNGGSAASQVYASATLSQATFATVGSGLFGVDATIPQKIGMYAGLVNAGDSITHTQLQFERL
jgi:hypothetical protein